MRAKSFKQKKWVWCDGLGRGGAGLGIGEGVSSERVCHSQSFDLRCHLSKKEALWEKFPEWSAPVSAFVPARRCCWPPADTTDQWDPALPFTAALPFQHTMSNKLIRVMTAWRREKKSLSLSLALSTNRLVLPSSETANYFKLNTSRTQQNCF